MGLGQCLKLTIPVVIIIFEARASAKYATPSCIATIFSVKCPLLCSFCSTLLVLYMYILIVVRLQHAITVNSSAKEVVIQSATTLSDVKHTCAVLYVAVPVILFGVFYYSELDAITRPAWGLPDFSFTRSGFHNDVDSDISQYLTIRRKVIST